MSRVRSSTPLRFGTALFGLAVVVALAAYLYDHAHRDRIANGVRIAGIDVGGLSESAARSRLERRVAASMERPVVVEHGGRTWRMSPHEAGVSVDVQGTVAGAVAASREGSIISRTWRGLTGGSVHRDLPLQVSYSRVSVRAFADRVRTAVDRSPRDATVQPAEGGLHEVPDRAGLAVDGLKLEHRIDSALTSATASRTLSVPVRTLRPAVSTGQLAARYPAYIVVDRERFQLLFYSHLKLANMYPIAVGMQGLETPAGLYHIQWKQVDPPWYVPNSAWAGALAGKVIPPGPEDPLKARFMSFDGGAGIHGIDPSEYGTIGHNASHGCVRMRIPDVIALYARTPVGTPVYVL